MILPHCCSCSCTCSLLVCSVLCTATSRGPSIRLSVCLCVQKEGGKALGDWPIPDICYIYAIYFIARDQSKLHNWPLELCWSCCTAFAGICWYYLLVTIFCLLCSCCFWYFSRVCLFVFVSRRASLSVGKLNLFVNKAVTSLRLLSLLLSPITHIPPPFPLHPFSLLLCHHAKGETI